MSSNVYQAAMQEVKLFYFFLLLISSISIGSGRLASYIRHKAGAGAMDHHLLHAPTGHLFFFLSIIITTTSHPAGLPVTTLTHPAPPIDLPLETNLR